MARTYFYGFSFSFSPFLIKLSLKDLELERDIKQTQENVSNLREQVQSNFSIIPSSISTISNLSNQVTVNLPGMLAAKQAKEELGKVDDINRSADIENIKGELLLEDEDKIMALARTRIRIEYMLRSILGKRLEVKKPTERPVKLKN